MLQNPMTSISTSSGSTFSHQDDEKLDLESVSALANTINQHINALLANDKAWMSLKLKCTSKLNIQKQPTFEFSEYSIVSNLYWGIEDIDAALQAKGQEERASRLQNSEKMLQVPASLHEQGVTSGIPNGYLICCSYFYLSVVRKLQSDDWQAALHFLQALLVSPRLVHEEFAPEVCQSILHFYIRQKRQERPGRRLSKSASVMDIDEDQAIEIIGWMAKEYKAWLLYYQIMSNGEHGSKHSANGDIDIADDDKHIM